MTSSCNKSCLCGSGRPAEECHGNDLPTGRLRNLLTYDVSGLAASPKVLITETFKSESFEKREFIAEIYFLRVSTPAGQLIYPLYLQHDNRVLRPTTIDGNHFLHADDTLYQMFFCNLTPLSHGSACIDMRTARQARYGVIKAQCRLSAAGNPFSSVFAIEAKDDRIRLHHFTTEENRRKIAASRRLNGSRWNLQGTDELTQLHYVYLTDLQSIENTFDLMGIGMALEGTVNVLATDDLSQVERLTVYRSNPSARDQRITVWVDPLLIAPQPLILHEPQHEHAKPIQFSSWEVVHNSIFRIPVKLGGSIPLAPSGQPDVYVVEDPGDHLSQTGFIAAHGMDIIGMLRIYLEACGKHIKRPGGPTLADLGMHDPMWVKTWSNNLSAQVGSTWRDIAKDDEPSESESD